MSPRPSRRQVLKWGAIALGALAIVAVVAYALVQRWLHARAEPVALATLAGADTALALVYDLRPDDPEGRRLARDLASRHAALRPWAPEAVWLIAHLGYADPGAFVEGLLPIHLGVLVERDGSVLRYASFSNHARLVARILAEEQGKLGPAVGHALGRPIHAQGAEFVATWEHTHLAATTRARLEAALTRLAGGAAESAATELVAAMPHDRPLAAALLDRGGFLERALDRARDDRGQSLATALRMDLGLGAEHVDRATLSATPGPTELVGRLAIGLATTAAPTHADRAMGSLLDEIARRFLVAGLAIEHTTRRDGTTIEVTFAIRNLDKLWREAMSR